MSGTFKINGVAVKTPKKVGISYNKIAADSSGRDAAGFMHIDYIATKTKLEVEWGPMSDFEVSRILSLIKQTFFTIEYPDAEQGRQVTKTFYSGDPNLDSYSWNNKFEQIKWAGLSTNFIER